MIFEATWPVLPIEPKCCLGHPKKLYFYYLFSGSKCPKILYSILKIDALDLTKASFFKRGDSQKYRVFLTETTKLEVFFVVNLNDEPKTSVAWLSEIIFFAASASREPGLDPFCKGVSLVTRDLLMVLIQNLKGVANHCLPRSFRGSQLIRNFDKPGNNL